MMSIPFVDPDIPPLNFDGSIALPPREATADGLDTQKALQTAAPFLRSLEAGTKVASTVINGKACQIMPYYMEDIDHTANAGVWKVTTPGLSAKLEMHAVKLGEPDLRFDAVVTHSSRRDNGPLPASVDDMQEIARVVSTAYELSQVEVPSPPSFEQRRHGRVAGAIKNLLHSNKDFLE